MPRARKGDDLHHVPRVALHSIPWDSRQLREGATDVGAADAKVNGIAVLATDAGDLAAFRAWLTSERGFEPPDWDLFTIDIDTLTVISADGGQLVVDRWWDRRPPGRHVAPNPPRGRTPDVTSITARTTPNVATAHSERTRLLPARVSQPIVALSRWRAPAAAARGTSFDALPRPLGGMLPYTASILFAGAHQERLVPDAGTAGPANTLPVIAPRLEVRIILVLGECLEVLE